MRTSSHLEDATIQARYRCIVVQLSTAVQHGSIPEKVVEDVEWKMRHIAGSCSTRDEHNSATHIDESLPEVNIETEETLQEHNPFK